MPRSKRCSRVSGAEGLRYDRALFLQAIGWMFALIDRALLRSAACAAAEQQHREGE
jgi:hypothetical protein